MQQVDSAANSRVRYADKTKLLLSSWRTGCSPLSDQLRHGSRNSRGSCHSVLVCSLGGVQELSQRLGGKRGYSVHLQARLLVTGGSGFVGSHLCERLLAKGANVICVDNFYPSSRSNIEHLLDNKHFELIRHDVIFPLYI
jgi:GDP-mannose 4,6 dehydratase